MKQFNKCVIAKKHGRLSILIANKCNINHDKLKCPVPLCSTTRVLNKPYFFKGGFAIVVWL